MKISSSRLFPWDLEYMEETKQQLAAGDARLELELMLCRLALARLAESTNRFWEMPAEQVAEAAGALFRGAKIVSQILQNDGELQEAQREQQAWLEPIYSLLEEE